METGGVTFIILCNVDDTPYVKEHEWAGIGEDGVVRYECPICKHKIRVRVVAI